MTKKKSNWNLYNFPDNINDVDDYIKFLTSVVEKRPEVTQELKDYNNFLTGYMRGVLDTTIGFKSMTEEVIAGREDPEDPNTQKIKKLNPRFLNGYHGIANSEHLNMSEERFMSYVDELNAKGQIPSGHWEDNEWGTKTYYFDRKKGGKKDEK